jgi:uncharacterized protein YukE
MNKNLQYFGFNEAQSLRTTLVKELDGINAALDNVKKVAETSKEWWKGGSEEAFIANLDKTKKDVSKNLEKWLKEYEMLIKKVEETRRAQESKLKQALSK